MNKKVCGKKVFKKCMSSLFLTRIFILFRLINQKLFLLMAPSRLPVITWVKRNCTSLFFHRAFEILSFFYLLERKHFLSFLNKSKLHNWKINQQKHSLMWMLRDFVSISNFTVNANECKVSKECVKWNEEAKKKKNCIYPILLLFCIFYSNLHAE